ncbi:MAG: hypothetical protein AAGE59_24605 [Cyanobacteria bacterium P01_F01_bin.86]
MLSQFFQSVCRTFGCLPAVLFLYPFAVSAKVFDASTTSVQFLPTDVPSKESSRLQAFKVSGSSVNQVRLLTLKDEDFGIGHNQGPAELLATLSEDKPGLPKNKLTSASPLLSEFVLVPYETPSLQSLTELDYQPVNDRVSAPQAVAQRPPQSEESELDLTQGQDPQRDPELGVIRLRDPLQDPELGVIRLRDPQLDPELGILQLRPLPPAVPDPPDPAAPPEPQEPPRRRPFLYLTTYVSAFSSDNAFLRTDPIQIEEDLFIRGDTFIRPGISLTAFPSIGPRTFLLASVEASSLRYQEFEQASYNELRFRAGIRHSFTNRVYGQLSWSNQSLFREGFDQDSRFFTQNSIELFLGRRDPLSSKLTLDTYYQGQLFFSNSRNPRNVSNEASRLSQSLGASLSYQITPQLDSRLTYQIVVSDFTVISRHETSQRITAQLRYSLSPSVRMSLFGGIGLGRSSESDVSFDNTFFGVSLDATLSLF